MATVDKVKMFEDRERKLRQRDERKLLKAADQASIISFMYLKKGEKQYEQRVIEVEHVRRAQSSGEMYVHGFDIMRQEFRNFQLGRVRPGSIKIAE